MLGFHLVYEMKKVPNNGCIRDPIFIAGLNKAPPRGSAMVCEGGLVSVVYACADTVWIYQWSRNMVS